ncbi:MAG: hypothetical protein OEZ22_03590 [Spirochaetia bacterium]|nr:hypothetical protein [Spirochaetia bacterium]
MEIFGTALLTVHVVSSIFWGGGSAILALVINPIFNKYRDYLYFQNYREELTQKYIRFLNISLFTSIVSGTFLIFVFKKNILEVKYILFFMVKMFLLLISFFLIYPYLKIGNRGEKENDLITNLNNSISKEKVFNYRSIAFLILITALVYISIFLRKYFYEFM